ncbi:hypothetical protein OOJ96_20400 [Pseudomonas sp. 15FMM2]|uniref:Uncharacterized protein n=1 Tax=Pseudomonas imrae TaxID=2992837 RepID=A0ACC7PJQ3_9PSED
MHKHWCQIKNIYIDSNRVFSYQRLKAKGRKRDIMPALATSLAIIAISSTLYVFQNPLWPIVCLTGVAISMLVFFKSMESRLAKYYPVEYEQYDISNQPWSERIDFLAYAIFLQEIKQAGYAPAKLKAIVDYSETLISPPKPFMINQHFTTVILISLLVSLFSAYIQKTQAWSAEGLVYVWAIASLSVVVSLVLDGFRTVQTRDSRIRRYLKRAQIELEQEANETTAVLICNGRETSIIS